MVKLDLDNLEDFNPDDIELRDGEKIEDIEGSLYLSTTDSKGNPIKRKIKIKPKIGRCNARTRVGFCWGWPRKGDTSKRCKWHGGKNAKTQLMQDFKTGQYSEFVPSKLQQIYEDVRQAHENKDLNSEIELLNAYVQFYISQSEHGLDIPEVWEQAKGHVCDIKQALSFEDIGQAQKSIESLETLLNPVNRAALSEDRAIKLIEKKVKVVDKQSTLEHRQAQQGFMYDAQIVLSLMYGLLEKVNEIMISQHIANDIRQAILQEIAIYSESPDFSGLLGDLAQSTSNES